MTAAPSALLVELEGVVADTTAARRAALRRALAEIGRALPDDALAQAADRRATAVAAAAAARALALDDTDAELTALRADRALDDLTAGAIYLVPGARESLAALASRVRIVVVTRAPAVVAERVLARAELDAVVTGVVAAEHALAPKPSPAGHRRALERLARVGVRDPSGVVALEDSPDGVAAARAAGVLAIAVGDGARDASHAAAWVAGVGGVHYDALVDLLENRGARGT